MRRPDEWGAGAAAVPRAARCTSRGPARLHRGARRRAPRRQRRSGPCPDSVRRRRSHRRGTRGRVHGSLLAAARAPRPMIFHSLDFVVFFLVTTAVYWCLPRRGQNAAAARWRATSSTATSIPWFLTLIVATTVVDYLAARGMDAWPDRRRLMLGLSLAVNLGLLGFFKYFNFFADNVQAALARGRARPADAGAARRAAGRHLVLHVPGAVLHDRRLPRHDPRAARLPRLRGVRLLLPAAGGRADRARGTPAAADRAAAALVVDRRA